MGGCVFFRFGNIWIRQCVGMSSDTLVLFSFCISPSFSTDTPSVKPEHSFTAFKFTKQVPPTGHEAAVLRASPCVSSNRASTSKRPFALYPSNYCHTHPCPLRDLQLGTQVSSPRSKTYINTLVSSLCMEVNKTSPQVLSVEIPSDQAQTEVSQV